VGPIGDKLRTSNINKKGDSPAYVVATIKTMETNVEKGFVARLGQCIHRTNCIHDRFSWELAAVRNQTASILCSFRTIASATKFKDRVMSQA